MKYTSETAKFTENIMDVAKKEAQKIITQAENERLNLLKEARSAIEKEASEIISNAEAEAEIIKARQLSESRHRVKLREQLEKDKLLTGVLEETKKRVLEIVKDDSKYFSFLTKLGSDAILQLGAQSVTIHLNAEDLKRVDITRLVQEITKELKSPTKIEVCKDPIAASGGIVVSSPDGKIQIVSTFEQRFEALEPKLLVEAGRLLFSERK